MSSVHTVRVQFSCGCVNREVLIIVLNYMLVIVGVMWCSRLVEKLDLKSSMEASFMRFISDSMVSSGRFVSGRSSVLRKMMWFGFSNSEVD